MGWGVEEWGAPKLLNICTHESESRKKGDKGKCHPSPILLNHILTHTCDQGSETHSNQHSVSTAKEPAWRQDALAKTATQAPRTARAPGTMPPSPLQNRHVPHRQTSRKANGPWFLFIFLFHTGGKRQIAPSLLPLH